MVDTELVLERLASDLDRINTRVDRKKPNNGQSNELVIAKRQVASADLRLSTMLRQGRDDCSREVKKLKIQLDGLSKQREALESLIVYWQNLDNNYDETIAGAKLNLKRKEAYEESLVNPEETPDQIRAKATKLLETLVAADKDIKNSQQKVGV